MSGGFFEHREHWLIHFSEEITEVISNNEIEDEYGYKTGYSEETLNEFKKTIELLKLTYTYLRRIDYLISGDDSEESFHKRLKEELL